MHDRYTRFSQVSRPSVRRRLSRPAKAKAQEVPAIGSVGLWFGMGLALIAFMVLQSF